MSGSVKCFDIVSMVVDEATSQFAPIWKIDNKKYKILEQYCGLMDSIAEEFDGVSFDVEVDDVLMTTTISMECDEITIESQNWSFNKLASGAISFGFSVSEDGLLDVKFIFPSVWDKV